MPRHHLVPQMVLRRFADDAERIVMVRRDPPHEVVLSTVRKAAAESGFYRIESEDVAESHREGHDPELVEKILAEVEGAARPLLDDLVAGRFPSWEDRLPLSLFVALQAVRGPGMREEMERLATLAARTRLSEMVTEERIRAWLEERGRPAAPSDVRAFIGELLRDGAWSLRMSQPHAVQETLRHGLDVVLPLVYLRAWKVVRFNADVLLTSDAPVAPWSPPSRTGLPVGLANARDTYMPLDRRTVLVVTRRSADGTPDRFEIEHRNARAARVNTAVAGNAHRWLYHHPQDRPMQHVRPGPRARWVEETVSAELGGDGKVRVRTMYVKRPVGEDLSADATA